MVARTHYKGQYFIVFYDEADEELLYMFDNAKEILIHQKKPITRNNLNLVNVELYRALRRKDHLTRFLNGEWMKIYIIDNKEENDL